MPLFHRRKKNKLESYSDSKLNVESIRKKVLASTHIEKDQFIPNFIFKIVLFGDEESGKKEFIKSDDYRSFLSEDTKLSIGLDLSVKNIKLANESYKLQIWDLDLDLRWRAVIKKYCQGTLGALIIYDIEKSISITDLDDWVHIIRENNDKIPIILIIINKELETQSVMSLEEIKEIAKLEGINEIIECNVETGENCEKPLKSVVKLIKERFN